jgi:hypothetical protein
MIGQMFDNIWIYLKDVTNLYAANNNPFVGISLEEVANAIRNAGVQLYTNTSISDNIYYSILGINQTGSSLPLTSSAYATVVESSSSLYPATGSSYLSSSLYLPPFGEEKINRYVLSFITGSNQIFNTLPNSQLTGEIYKRIYHNLPYLLKSRGTARGLQALITVFGPIATLFPIFIRPPLHELMYTFKLQLKLLPINILLFSQAYIEQFFIILQLCPKEIFLGLIVLKPISDVKFLPKLLNLIL